MTTTDIRLPTWLELIQSVASEFGQLVTIQQAESILWENTGYPLFWPNRDISPAENCRNQVRDFFAGQQSTR